ncbi:ribose transport system substrate-binding protein [Aequitasia blattaphilus]|uniref:Substrate-binding domain-containing protein n=1 Tax=Aequitasia blattaphilus TaxID=2949332 RepID=A0ABT1EDD9_9FIRM|nr:substrate-binding domain-containing protein [Aequitasia blattaphilus]MCP1103661.1 substrate-binding domain-containing protein [Aequitasia blattaphilus]MCR8616301.1 substrate-binding domain-containing protein [Aequitasia blattaphilus]
MKGKCKKIVGVLVALLLLLSGCAEQEGYEKSYIAVIPKYAHSDYFREVAKGVNIAAIEYSVTTSFEGAKNEEDYQTQNDLIDRAVEAGADAIVLSAIDYNKSVESLEKAHKAGVKIISIDSGVNFDDVYQTIESDNYETGKQAAEEMLSLRRGEVKVGIVNFDKNSANGIERERGFRERMEQEERVTIVDAINTVSNVSEATDEVVEMLQAHADINSMVAFNEFTSLGAGYAVKELQLGNQVDVVAVDNSIPSIGMVETGEIDKLLVQNPFAMGYLGIESAVNAIKNVEPTQKHVYTSALVVDRNNLYDVDSQRFVFPFD